MGSMESRDVEKILEENPFSIVRYYSKNHQGFANEDPHCVGMVFDHDLYLLVDGRDPDYPRPYYCVESESRSATPGDEKRFMFIESVSPVVDFRDERERLAKEILDLILEGKFPSEYDIYIMDKRGVRNKFMDGGE